MNKAYLQLLATRPKTVLLWYIAIVGTMTTASCFIAPYSTALLWMARLSVLFFFLGLIDLLVDYRKAKRMQF